MKRLIATSAALALLLLGGCAGLELSGTGERAKSLAQGITTKAANPWPDGCITSLSFGQTASGQLSSSDCSWYYSSSPSNRYYTDLYRFNGTAGQRIALSLSSTVFDTMLELYDVNDISATPLVANDDSAQGVTNSRIPPGSGWYTLPRTGTYYVTASSYNPNTSGAYTLALESPDGATPLVPSTNLLTVTEFYHPQFNHYFITAYADEAAFLAAGNLRPWETTGQTFKVWSGPASGISNVCRFFSATFAPRSSHFYSGSALECPGLSAGGVWQLESSTAFYMMQSPTGTCPSGTMPLYRLYNNGSSGAPNHRYTVHASVRTTMIAAGWVPEGNGPDGVFACVPQSTSPPPVTGSEFQREVSGYVNTILGFFSGDIVDMDQLGVILGSALQALIQPTGSCPVATSNPPLAGLDTLPPNLTINVDYGSGCTVQGTGTSANVAGSVVITANNVVFSDTTVQGTVGLSFNNVRINGTPVASGSVQATLNLVVNAAQTSFTGTVNVTLTNLTLPGGFGVNGTAAISLNSTGTTTVTTHLTTSPNNVALHLSASVLAQSDGSVLVNTFGTGNTVGPYTVQAVNLRIDADVCAGAMGGSLSFTKGGQTGTLTFNSACGYTYTGP